jgi:outer membrane protein assembly factor BamA
MLKTRLQISVFILLLAANSLFAQNKYQLVIKGADSLSASTIPRLALTTTFNSTMGITEYVLNLVSQLQAKGYVTASVDSLQTKGDSTFIQLYTGSLYRWAELNAYGIEEKLLDAVGWRPKMFDKKPMDFSQVQSWQERFLSQLENKGYPFAKVYLDSFQLEDEKVSALLKINKGPLYKIDSIRLYGNAKISNNYLQRYLDIPNGSIYSKEKLLRINKKIRELTYVEEEKPADLTMLGTGSVLNMYLKQKKSSQVNVLVGFLPNNNQLASKKMLITGEGNLNLKNTLGSGETIGLNFQALQVESQRLNFLYQHPYLFRSPFGLDFAFDMFRKDSSFVNVNFQIGAQYVLSTNQAGKVFFQRFSTILNQGGVNGTQVIQTRRLPAAADVSSMAAGVDYEYNNTDYRFNPRKGNDIRVITSVGTKKIKKNNEVLDLKDPGDPSFNFDRLYDTVKLKTYQFRVRLTAARFFPLGNQRSTIKTALNGGFFQSGNIFRNELFQIGGYKLLRGFDEESQYLSQFAVATVEYRYLVGQNSFFFALADGGWGRDASRGQQLVYTYFGTGLGLAFETKAGIFNLAWAVGKRNDTEFNLRQSKIHFGFVNYF